MPRDKSYQSKNHGGLLVKPGGLLKGNFTLLVPFEAQSPWLSEEILSRHKGFLYRNRFLPLGFYFLSLLPQERAKGAHIFSLHPLFYLALSFTTLSSIKEKLKPQMLSNSGPLRKQRRGVYPSGHEVCPSNTNSNFDKKTQKIFLEQPSNQFLERRKYIVSKWLPMTQNRSLEIHKISLAIKKGHKAFLKQIPMTQSLFFLTKRLDQDHFTPMSLAVTGAKTHFNRSKSVLSNIQKGDPDREINQVSFPKPPALRFAVLLGRAKEKSFSEIRGTSSTEIHRYFPKSPFEIKTDQVFNLPSETTSQKSFREKSLSQVTTNPKDLPPSLLQGLADRLFEPLMKRWKEELERRGVFGV